MTDHPDDNILDDDVEEHDFNFDNEKEDALLADTEFDHFNEKSVINNKQKILSIQGGVRPNSRTTQDLEQLDQEDVLDIGIAEEDIVETEATCLPNDHGGTPGVPDFDNGVTEETGLEKNSVSVLKIDRLESSEMEFEHNSSKIEEWEDGSLKDAQQMLNDDFATKESCKHGNEKNEIVKSSVISLKTNVKKSYDNLPDLAKVIELVRPCGSSRLHKHNKTVRHHFAKKKRNNDVVNVTKRSIEHSSEGNNFEECGLCGSTRGTWNEDYCKKDPKNTNRSHYHQSASESDRADREKDAPLPVTKESTFHDLVSKIPNFPAQRLLASKDICDERSVLTTIQITQERYHIASNFHIIRPSIQDPVPTYLPETTNYSCVNSPPMFRSLVAPTIGTRPFYSATTLSRSNTNPAAYPSPPQLPSDACHTNVESRPHSSISAVNFSNQCPPPAAVCPPPPIPFPQNFLPNTRMSPRFSQPSFPPPFPPSSDLPQPSSNLYYHPQSRAFSTPSTPFHYHHLAQRPPPPLPDNSNSAPSTASFDIQKSVAISGPPYFSGHRREHQREPFPPSLATPTSSFNPLRTSFAQRTLFSPQSSNFRQSRPIIRMPPPQSFFINNQRINNQQSFTITQSADYCSEGNVATSSSSPLSFSARCDFEVSSQPPPPGVLVNHSAHSIAFSGEEVRAPIRFENDEMERSRLAQGKNFSNSFPNRLDEKMYYHTSNEYRIFQNETVSSDRNLNFRPSKRIASTSVDSFSNGNFKKQMRYHHSDIKRDIDDGMEAYRKQVEQQKEIREQFIQMKEEQRLKNQMQNFIQNNIKGILQKREKFLNKNKEVESSFTGSSSVGNKNDHSVINVEEKNHDDRNNKSNTKPCSLPTKQKETLTSDTARTFSKDNTCKSPVARNFRNTVDLRFNDCAIEEADTRQLHKVVKIKYKDGTVALKSFPVKGPPSISASFSDKSSIVDNLNVTVQDENVSTPNSNPRRMVVSKQTSSNVEHKCEDESSPKNENIIVESVRKGVTQSSVPLAQRFSNLKYSAFKDEDAENTSSLSVKSTNRLVIKDEDETRTVSIQNIGLNTKPTVIQGIACTCGQVTKINWLKGNGRYKQANVTFSKPEEARKFVHNYNKRVVDFSVIAVTLISKNK